MRFLFTLSVVLFPALVVAQDDPGLDLDPVALISSLVSAVRGGQWSVAGLILFIAAIYVLRRFGSKRIPWLSTDEGGAWLLFGTVLAGGFLPAALSGSPVTWALVKGTFLAAAALGGSWALGRRLLRSLVPLIAKIPGIGGALATAADWLTGSRPGT